VGEKMKAECRRLVGGNGAFPVVLFYPIGSYIILNDMCTGGCSISSIDLDPTGDR